MWDVDYTLPDLVFTSAPNLMTRLDIADLFSFPSEEANNCSSALNFQQSPLEIF